MLDKKRYYPQTILEEFKYEGKKTKIENIINDDLDPSSSKDETDSDSDNDESTKSDNDSDNESSDQFVKECQNQSFTLITIKAW